MANVIMLNEIIVSGLCNDFLNIIPSSFIMPSLHLYCSDLSCSVYISNNMLDVLNLNSFNHPCNLIAYIPNGIDFTYYSWINKQILLYKYYPVYLYVPYKYTFVYSTLPCILLKKKLIYSLILSLPVYIVNLLYIICIFILVLLFLLLIIALTIYFLFIIILFLLWLYLNNYITSKFLFIFILFLLFRNVNAFNLPDLNNGYTTMTFLGFFVYILLLSIYDYFLLNDVLLGKRFISNKTVYFLIMGLLYVITISVGIFQTNSVWFLTEGFNYNDGGLWFTICSLINILTSAFWVLLKTMVYNVVDGQYLFFSIFRSISEAFSFNSICWATYWLWSMLNTLYIPYFDYIFLILGLVLHFFSSIFVLYIETIRRITTMEGLTYGFLNYLSWIGIVLHTNSLLNIMSPSLIGFTIQLSLSLLFLGLIILLHPLFYRGTYITIRRLLRLVIENYLLIVAYVLFNYFIYQPFIG
jgi:hypothetical protein